MPAENNIPGLYVHVPFCDGKCGYCAFYSKIYNTALADRYLSALEQELAGICLRPETIYIGGGTPTILSVQQLIRLREIMRRGIANSRLTEWTVEANPGSLDAGKLDALVSSGVNRISLGAQSFSDQTLAFLGRRHNAEDTRRSVKLARAAGIKNLNLDLIACIPGVGQNSWENTIRQVLDLKPEHISVYALTPEEGTCLIREIRNGDIAMQSEDEQLGNLDIAECMLEKAGFGRYEISNYAKPGFECRHNISCWRGEEYIGLGAAAASHVGLARKTNVSDIDRYIEALEKGKTPLGDREVLTPELKTVERLVFGLRMAEGVKDDLCSGRLATLQQLQRDGLTVLKNGRWALTRKGRDLADYAGSELLAY